MTTVNKGKIFRNDMDHFDGVDKTASRKDSTGGTVTGLVVGYEVDVLIAYGNGESYTWQTINDCIRRIGSASVTLVFNPGTWTIDQNLTIGSNFTCRIPAGCVFSVSSGKTLTFSGPVIRDSSTWTSGSGTVTENGTRTITGLLDLTGAVIQGTNALVFEGSTANAFETTFVITDPTADRTITIPNADVDLSSIPSTSGNNTWSGNQLYTGTVTNQGIVNYAASSGTDTYTATLAPAITSYTTGAEYKIKFGSANTSTTPTLNINSLGAKTIKKGNGTALIPGDITANHEAVLRYNGTDMILLNPKWTPGTVIQVVSTTTSSYTSCGTAIPDDDTIPQLSTEGTTVLTRAITPQSASSTLLVQVIVHCSSDGTAGQACIALHRDSTESALSAVRSNSDQAQKSITIPLNHAVTSGSTSATTFKVNLGPSSGTVYFNGSSAARILGGISGSSITVWEIAP